MTKFAVALVAAAVLAAPAFTTPAAADSAVKLAQADVNVRVGPGGVRIRSDADRDRRYRYREGYRAYGRDRGERCSRTVVIRDGRRTTITRCR